MHRCRPAALLVSLLTLSWMLLPASAHAATANFTVSATNVTMPAKGLGMSTLTVTSQNGFSGSVVVSCALANASMGAHLPLCVHLPGPGVVLAADQSTKSSLYLVPYGMAPPPGNAGSRTPGKHRAAATLALAGALLLGFGFRRRVRRLGWLILAATIFAASAGITACGGGNQGTFVYNIVATDNATGASTNTTIAVTIP